MARARSTSEVWNLRPMRRFTAYTVLRGFVSACLRAICPTRSSPSAARPTTDGVVRAPSRFGTTTGRAPSTTAAHELVVPRSIPMILPIGFLWILLWRGLRRSGDRHGDDHECGADQPLAEDVTLLEDLHDRRLEDARDLVA